MVSVNRLIKGGGVYMNKEQKILDIIKESIDYYDPEGLLKIGAPKNEYLLEARNITYKLLSSEINQLSTIIHETFLNYFGDAINKSLLEQIVKRITTNLNQS